MPVAPEINARYSLTTPVGIGQTVTFNDPTSPAYVGVITEHSGFDSPEIREESENRPGTDGAVHGQFLFGRRPMTLTGMVINPASTLERAARIEKLQQVALNCLRTDGLLSWTVSDGTVLWTNVRLQQPLRIEGAWQKQFQLAMVAADPRIYGNEVSAMSRTNVTASFIEETFNVTGTASTPLRLVFDLPKGYTGTFLVEVTPNYQEVQKFKLNLTGGMPERTPGSANTSIVINSGARIADAMGQNLYSKVDVPVSTWPMLYPGSNTVKVTLASSQSGLGSIVRWNPAYW